MNEIHEFSDREPTRSAERGPSAASRNTAPFLSALSGADPLRVHNAAHSPWADVTGAYLWGRR
jgi:hypothetical protein